MTRRNGALQRTAGAAGWARSGWLSVAVALLVALLVALAGCASQQIVERPAPGESSAEAVVETPPPQRIEHQAPATQAATLAHVAFESRQVQHAQALSRRGQLAESALAWEALILLRPERSDYRQQWADARRRIEQAVADYSSRAAQAQRRGDTQAAAPLYLAALALAPEHVEAANALRALERERNARLYLGKHSRLTLIRSSAPESASLQSRNDIEHAGLQAGQGDIDAAIALLQQRFQADPGDVAVRIALADLHFQKAEQLVPSNRSAAIAALEQGLRLDASNRSAVERLQGLRAVPVAKPAARAASAPARP